VLGRIRVEEWADKATQAKRTGTKIVAATLDRVRPYSGARPPAIPMARRPPPSQRVARLARAPESCLCPSRQARGCKAGPRRSARRRDHAAAL